MVPSIAVEDVVYGLVYSLTPSDEQALDLNEGVPYAYTKQMLSVKFWASADGSQPVNIKSVGEKTEMLV